MADNQVVDNNDLTDFTAGSKDVGGVQYQQVILTNDDASINADLKTAGAHDCQKIVIYDHSGNEINSFSGTGGTSIADDAAFTVGTTNVTPAGGVFTTDTINSGDAGAIAIDASRRQLVSLEVDNVGLATSTNQSTANTSLSNIDTNTTDIPNVIGTDGAAGPSSTISVAGTESGGNLQEIRVDSDGHLQVDVLGTVTVDLSTNNDIQGQVAHDSAVSGNPVHIGAEARTSNGTAVGNGDAVRVQADTLGKQVVLPYGLLETVVQGDTGNITNTSDTSTIAAQGAGVRTYITHISVSNSHATVGTWVNIKDGTTTMYTIYAKEDGGGATITLPTPLRGTANTAWNAANETTGSNTRVNLVGFTSTV